MVGVAGKRTSSSPSVDAQLKVEVWLAGGLGVQVKLEPAAPVGQTSSSGLLGQRQQERQERQEQEEPQEPLFMDPSTLAAWWESFPCSEAAMAASWASRGCPDVPELAWPGHLSPYWRQAGHLSLVTSVGSYARFVYCTDPHPLSLST